MPLGRNGLIELMSQCQAWQRQVHRSSFFESNAIKLPGTKVPPTYVYVPGTSGNSSVP